MTAIEFIMLWIWGIGMVCCVLMAAMLGYVLVKNIRHDAKRMGKDGLLK